MTTATIPNETLPEIIKVLTPEIVAAEDTTTHLECGGSNSSQWFNCGMSVILGRQVERGPAGKAAVDGTFQHAANEMATTDFLKHKEHGTDPDARTLASFANYPAVIEQAFEYRERMWKELFKESVTGKVWFIEEAVVARPDIPAAGGPVDTGVIYKDDRGRLTAHLNDYKNGVVLVSPDSFQNRVYALALMRVMDGLGKRIDTFITSIYQPNAGLDDPYSEKRFTRKQIETFGNKVDKQINSIYGLDGKPKYKMGDWCTYCKAQTKCEKYQKELEKKSKINMLQVVQSSEPIAASSGWTDEQLALLVQHEDQFKEMLKQAKSHIMGACMRNPGYLGFKVVRKKGRRMWSDASGTLVKIMNTFDVKPEAVAQLKLRGIADVTKVLKTVASKQEVDTFLSTEFGETNPSMLLVGEDDPREPVTGTLDLLDVVAEGTE